jgi:hypothetical protein
VIKTNCCLPSSSVWQAGTVVAKPARKHPYIFLCTPNYAGLYS